MMTYREILEHFLTQFSWDPIVENKERLRPFKRIIVLAMGGSRLAPDMLNMYKPELDIRIHSDFGLPKFSREHLEEALIIVSSYSGDTDEPLSGVQEALDQNLNLAVITTGGALGDLMQKNQLPGVMIPSDSAVARESTGYGFLALAALLNIEILERKACAAITIEPIDAAGKALAAFIGNRIPLVYTSERFNELGYAWKLILNETAKIPAFCNRFPELAHNEIAGFGSSAAAGPATAGFAVVIIDDQGSPEISRRMAAVAEILEGKNIPTKIVPWQATSELEGILSSYLLAHYTALYLAEQAGKDPLGTTIIEQLKEKMKKP